MLVIVQNPGVSDLAFTNEGFKVSADFQQQPWPDPSTSSHEDQLPTANNSGNYNNNHEESVTPAAYSQWESDSNKDDAGYMEDVAVAVDVKGLKNSYSFLPCCDMSPRPLHSRSNSSKSLQGASVHYQSSYTK